MKLKICGMKYQDNINAVASLQPDYLGFIFHESSPRSFDGIIPKLSKKVEKVGVFVDMPIKVIIEKLNLYHFDMLQLHGKETTTYIKNLIKCITDSDVKFPKITKVFSIKDEFDFSVLEPYESICDYFLFDTKGKHPGGNGYTFNWNVLKNYTSTKPFILSGGIGLDQIDKLKEFKNSKASQYCYAIDVNSKFEIEPGLKNIEELKNFKNNICHVERSRDIS
jgi:phosphoribosylanthranilate isomerase